MWTCFPFGKKILCLTIPQLTSAHEAATMYPPPPEPQASYSPQVYGQQGAEEHGVTADSSALLQHPTPMEPAHTSATDAQQEFENVTRSSKYFNLVSLPISFVILAIWSKCINKATRSDDDGQLVHVYLTCYSCRFLLYQLLGQHHVLHLKQKPIYYWLCVAKYHASIIWICWQLRSNH